MKGRKPELGNVVPMRRELGEIPNVPDAPEWLREKARAVWEELAPHMMRLNRLQPEYLHQFAVYCEAVESFMDATACLAVEGYYFETETRNGRQQKKVAMWGVFEASASMMNRQSALFGLSPVDSARLKVTGQGDLFKDLMKQLQGDGPD